MAAHGEPVQETPLAGRKHSASEEPARRGPGHVDAALEARRKALLHAAQLGALRLALPCLGRRERLRLGLRARALSLQAPARLVCLPADARSLRSRPPGRSMARPCPRKTYTRHAVSDIIARPASAPSGSPCTLPVAALAWGRAARLRRSSRAARARSAASASMRRSACVRCSSSAASAASSASNAARLASAAARARSA